jgi:hypothetical protein
MHLLVISKIGLPAHFLATALLVSSALYQVANAQEPLSIPSFEARLVAIVSSHPRLIFQKQRCLSHA